MRAETGESDERALCAAACTSDIVVVKYTASAKMPQRPFQ